MTRGERGRKFGWAIAGIGALVLSIVLAGFSVSTCANVSGGALDSCGGSAVDVARDVVIVGLGIVAALLCFRKAFSSRTSATPHT